MAGVFSTPGVMIYAASHLAALAFRCASLDARGLLFTLYLETWVNGPMPADPAALGRVLGVPTEDVARLLPLLGDLVDRRPGGLLVCPEVERYRAEQQQRRDRHSAGGRMTGMKNSRRAKESRGTVEDAKHHADHDAKHDASGMLLREDELREEEERREELAGGGNSEWLEAFDREEARQSHRGLM